ncbi:MAG TPA: cytochrome c3 family protein [Phycisphaerae bacterium]|nr:cytochrome c3 family protein [Phycisphaerae bacterium]
MKTSEPTSTQKWRRRGAGVPSRPNWAGGLHYLLVLAVVGLVGYASVIFFQAAAKREQPPVPSTMEAVNWESPDSSEYCLACHRPIGPAMAGLDVKHGHPQNVRLSDAQMQAVTDLGTITGPDNTLICVTCHTLQAASNPYMLPDTLADGQFCERCHPGHYARGTPHDLRLTAANEKNRLGQTAEEGGPCSACHLAHRYAREFEPCDHDPDGRCTTCHEVDHCASSHARPTMEHPESRCLECHNPHDMTHGEFLNAPVATLCVRCHEGYNGGVDGGMHPITVMQDGVPQAVTDAGGWTGEEKQTVSCTLCHSIHDAENEQLLVFEGNSDRLCLTCHADQRGPDHGEGQLPRHGQSPVMSPEQRAVADQWDTTVGPNGELLCVTCHKVHHSPAKMSLLAFAPKYGETCEACHPGHGELFGTSHDLRTNHPDEKNLAGMTPIEFGACSACHLAHGYAREATPVPGDRTGECASCHQPQECAANQAINSVQHPQSTCTDCHNPHRREDPHYLARPESELCITCHAEQAKLIGGPHDPTRHPDRWPNPDEVKTGGPCTPCHVPHGGERGDQFRVHGAQLAGNHDDVCLVCHPNANWGTNSSITAIHPHEISPDQQKVELALVPKDDAGNMRMGCRTCHDPHGGAEPIHLARVAPDEPTESLCLHCHEPKKFIKQTGHSAESLSRFGYDVDSCKPCHAMHAKPDGNWGLMLSPRFLLKENEVVTGGHESRLPCLACHNKDEPAPVRDIATHPHVSAFQQRSPDSPGFLPLFNDDGQIDPHGHIVCRTCHVSHGRLDLLQMAAEKKEMSSAERRSIRTQLRSFETPNLCTDCHGEQARMKFLFFHDVQRRGQTH